MTHGRRIECYNDLVAAFASRKAELGLSDVTLDHAAGLATGHVGKLFAFERGIGAATFEALLMALAVDLVMVPNPVKLTKMQPYYVTRNKTWVRTNHRVGRRPLQRVMRELGKRSAVMLAERFGSHPVVKLSSRGGKARQAKLSPAERQELARVAATARWSRRMPGPDKP